MQIFRERLLNDKWLYRNEERAHQKITDCKKIAQFFFKSVNYYAYQEAIWKPSQKSASFRGTEIEVVISE